MATISQTQVVDWNVKYDLGYAAMATIHLTNADRSLSPSTEDLRGQILTLVGKVDDTNYTLFCGRIKSQLPSYAKDGTKIVTLEAVSVSESLTRRPINTHTYAEDEELEAQEIMQNLVEIYGGLNPAWHDLHIGDTKLSKILVANNSIMDGLKQIAQAASLIVYSRYDGQLVSAELKDVNSEVDYTMEPIDLEQELNEESRELDRVSACKVRGRYLTDDELYGPQTLLTNGVRSCTVQHEVYATYTFELQEESRYEFAEVLNSSVTVVDPNDPAANIRGYVAQFEPPRVKIGFEYMNGEWEDEEIDLEFGASVTLAPTTEAISVDSAGHGHGMSSVSDKKGIHQMLRAAILSFRTQDKQRTRLANERAEHRIDVLLGDNDLIDEMGLRYAEVDNLYIPDSDRAETVAKRIIYEADIAGHTFKCGGPFNPNLRELNKVVLVPICTGSVVEEYQKCLLTGITFKYDPKDSSLKSNYTFVKL